MDQAVHKGIVSYMRAVDDSLDPRSHSRRVV